MAEFVHLHNHTDYSLLDGAAPVSRLVKKAKSFGMPGIAITDHGNLFGAMAFEKECRDAGLNPIIGCEFYVAGSSRLEKTGTENGNKYWHFLLLAENLEGYHNLLKLTSSSFTEGFYYKPRIDDELLAANSRGLIASSACLAGEIPSLILAGKLDQAIKKIGFYKELFGRTTSTSSFKTTASTSSGLSTESCFGFLKSSMFPSWPQTICITSSAKTPSPTTSCSVSARTESAMTLRGCASRTTGSI